MNTQRLLAIGGLISLAAASGYALWVGGLSATFGEQVAQQSGLRPAVAQGAGAVFTEDEARLVAVDAAMGFLNSKDGPAERLVEQGYAPPLREALTITSVQFVKDARKVSSAYVTSEFSRPMSIWTVSFSVEGLGLVEVRLEDGTGTLRGATALPLAR